VFGFSFSELVVLVIVALIVIGPKDLPKVLRKLGMWAGKLRRMAADLRAQSGIDDVLRTEGLADDLAEIRKLARGEFDDIRRAVESVPKAASISDDPLESIDVDPQREYPREGADGYMALPDTAILYVETFPKSKLARDPLYVLGDPDGKLPEEPEAANGEATTETDTTTASTTTASTPAITPATSSTTTEAASEPEAP
jgi:sec-independent protein translocase protein TatB